MSAAFAPAPIPFGATYLGDGRTQFCVYVGDRARQVHVCLFPVMEQGVTDREIEMVDQVPLPWDGCRGRIHHVVVENCHPGQLYGYRVDGPWDPRNGDRYRPKFVLLDPYAKIIGRRLRWFSEISGHTGNDEQASEADNAAFCPLGVVVNGDNFDWGNESRPEIPWRDTVIYEAHVRGLTKTHPQIELPYRGTFSGLCDPVMIRHMKRLGVTAVELMPIQTGLPESLNCGVYWRYDTMAHFAMEATYCAWADPLARNWELKRCVKLLHAAQIEVILDVVFNHTAEGNQLGPTLSMRGLANGDYYRLCGTPEAGPYRYYDDHTGCGNTLNFESPIVIRFVLDCLRHWADTYHIDGFRFDLATVLGFHVNRFQHDSPFLVALAQDPVLSKLKLIAEPWDIRRHHIGGFPAGWYEWNDRYRDGLRRFWRSDSGMTAHFATGFAGSVKDLFVNGSRSINFSTSHDGFTLWDLVSYREKRNTRNGEGNRDGTPANWSDNYGIEGPTDDPAVQKIRLQQCRNLIATLMLSHGVPMILAGDEILRTQDGNNNAYAHDSPLTWLNWLTVPRGFLRFCQGMAAIRHDYPQVRDYFASAQAPEGEKLHWLNLEGGEMSESQWQDSERRAVGVYWQCSNGSNKTCGTLIAFNAYPDTAIQFSLPNDAAENKQWQRILDTSKHHAFRRARGVTSYTLEPRSLVMFVQ